MENEETTEESTEREINSLEDLKDELDEHESGDDSDDVGEVDIVAENDAKAAEEAPEEELAADSADTEAPAEEGGEEAYTPDLTYKVNGEEKTFEEKIHSLLDSKENEEHFREIYQKAEAFDTTKEKLEQYRGDYTNLAHTVNSVLDARDSGDYKTMFSALQLNNLPLSDMLEGLGVDKEAIIKHAYSLATLTPEEETTYNAQRELEAKNRKLETDQQVMNQRFEQIQAQSQQNQLQSELSRPGIAEIVKDFDGENGQGAFWDEVVSRGIYSFNVTGQDKSASDLVNEVVTRFNLKAPQAPERTNPSPAEAQAKQGELPVIPSTGNSSKGPTTKVFTSIKELEKEADEYISSRS